MVPTGRVAGRPESKVSALDSKCASLAGTMIKAFSRINAAPVTASPCHTWYPIIRALSKKPSPYRTIRQPVQSRRFGTTMQKIIHETDVSTGATDGCFQALSITMGRLKSPLRILQACTVGMSNPGNRLGRTRAVQTRSRPVKLRPPVFLRPKR